MFMFKAKDFWNNKYEYDTYTIVREVIDEKINEVIDYELVNQEDRYFELPKFVKGIVRTGNHFLFSILTGDDSSDIGPVTWTNIWHYEYNEETNTFTQIGKLSGKPTLTKNPDIVILSHSNCEQLYHLGEKTLVGSRCSEIEDIDGNYFLVTNSIGAKKDGNTIRNHLIFKMDKDGNRVSGVYSRNKPGFVYGGVEIPYEEIEKREIQLLIDKLDGEENQKRLFRKSPESEEQ